MTKPLSEELAETPTVREVSADKRLIRNLERTIEELERQLLDTRQAKFTLPVGPRKKTKGKRRGHCCVIIPDSHGSLIDPGACAAFLNDLEQINPAEIVMLGDHLDCGGFLAQHHTLGYVAQSEYTFAEDVDAANQFLDAIQKRAPKAEIHYIMGNHERRVGAWIVTQTLRNNADAKYLESMFAPEIVLHLEQRGIKHYSQGVTYGGRTVPAILKLDNRNFMHGEFTGKNAAKQHVDEFVCNITFGHCFSEDTELLTSSGWKLFSDVSVGDVAATIRLDNGVTEWQAVKDVFQYDHYKELVHITSPSVDALVTPDHAMVLTSRKSSKMSDEIARSKLRRVTAKELIPKSAFTIPLSGINEQPDYPISDDMLRFVGWVITEGHVNNKIGRGGYIRISQSDSPKGGLRSLLGTLDSMGVRYTKKKRYEKCTVGHGQYRNFDAYTINVSRTDPSCEEFLSLCPTKTLQPWMLNLSHRQWKVLFRVLIMADGNKNHDAKNSFQYATKWPIEADLLQSLCAVNGWRTSRLERERKGAKYACITVNTRGLAHVTQTKPKLVPYDGKVWCCSVDNQTLIVRRRGKVFVAGNTHRADSYTRRTVDDTFSAFNPGCLCKLQQYYNHSRLTHHTHGYGIQSVGDEHSFLQINVPIIDGKSYLQPLAAQLGG